MLFSLNFAIFHFQEYFHVLVGEFTYPVALRRRQDRARSARRIRTILDNVLGILLLFKLRGSWTNIFDGFVERSSLQPYLTRLDLAQICTNCFWLANYTLF